MNYYVILGCFLVCTGVRAEAPSSINENSTAKTTSEDTQISILSAIPTPPVQKTALLRYNLNRPGQPPTVVQVAQAEGYYDLSNDLRQRTANYLEENFEENSEVYNTWTDRIDKIFDRTGRVLIEVGQKLDGTHANEETKKKFVMRLKNRLNRNIIHVMNLIKKESKELQMPL